VKLRMLLCSIALLVVGTGVKAQTTYTMLTPFLCDASGYYPLKTYGGEACRGIPLDLNGQPAGSAFIFSGIREGMNLPGVPYDGYGSITKWDYSTADSFQFEWEQNGGQHSGTATGTWENVKVCSNRCWYHPKFLTFSVTVNQ